MQMNDMILHIITSAMQVKMTRQSLALLCLVSSVKDIFNYIISDMIELKIEIFQIKIRAHMCKIH